MFQICYTPNFVFSDTDNEYNDHDDDSNNMLSLFIEDFGKCVFKNLVITRLNFVHTSLMSYVL